MSVKREHGKHNKKVCDHLNLQSSSLSCNDWIVTTAFYSSIHYLDHILFPCKYEGKEFKDINEAHTYINSRSKHQTRAKLVTELLPEHKGRYSFLIEESQNARYVDYNVNSFVSDKAVRELSTIAEFCDKNKLKN